MAGAVMAANTQIPGFERAKRDRSSAQHVLDLAAEGIRALAAGLDDSFIAALDLIERIPGKVVVSGMGKSGHVGRKIAATLASTGTAAFFVHPAEAGHGDLGMITKDDVVLALSNSGETAELDHVLAYARRFAIPVIAMTRNSDSSLAGAADITLSVPPIAEACPLGLAPTTSTTMMLALGDAIAVALLERKGFSTQDFQVLHPGGAIGHKLLRVSDLMHSGEAMPLVPPETKMSEAIVVMTTKSFGTLGIVGSDRRLIGIITDGDLRRHMASNLLERTVHEIMTNGPVTIRPEALAAEALGLMNARKKTCLFAVEDGRPVGLLHIHDCLRAGVA
jgi:arabinose-5-phosphate isomerase